ncbi:MAG: hypothetical protein FWH01_01290 [Oscillospiraceae bacterium]|nr:hypothetical protein [Oscillospiraceae bacterium]
MKKAKSNEIIKVAVAAVLAIGLFSAAFIGVNNLAFAAATGKTDIVQPVLAGAAMQTITATTAATTTATTTATAAIMEGATVTASTAEAADEAAGTAEAAEEVAEAAGTAEAAEVAEEAVGVAEAAAATILNVISAAGVPPTTEPTAVASTQNIPQAEYIKPNMNVYHKQNEWYTPGANALSYEEAAEIGAHFIWAMFGDSIDGKTVQMNYSSWPSHSRAYWFGNVADSKDTMDPKDTQNYEILYNFMICAVSGEWIDIWNHQVQTKDDDIQARAVFSELSALSPDEAEEIQRQRYAYPPPENYEEYMQTAMNYAAMYFNNAGADAVSIEMWEYSSYGRYGLDENGDIIIVPAKYLVYTVTGSAGRTAEVQINAETMELVLIETQNNDIIPGYNYDAPGGLG